MPFKRYQIAPVWRADNTQRGRFREFYQCDVDVVGSDSILADAEVIACLSEVLKSLGIQNAAIRINNRKYLDSGIVRAGVASANVKATLVALDKLEKIGRAGVEKELTDAGISKTERSKIFEFIEADFDGTGELGILAENLQKLGVKNYKVDPTLARGLDYYTGTIFEITLTDAPEFGSIAAGGRYDNLIGMFLTSPNPLLNKERDKGEVPAVGGSIGVDRLLSAMEKLELLKFDLAFDVLVCNLEESLLETYLEISKVLRAAGIKTDLYYGPAKLVKQLKYADKKNIKFAIIIGQDEEKNNSATVKNLQTGKQESVKQKQIINEIKKHDGQ